MVKEILDGVDSLSENLDGIIVSVEDLPASDDRDTVMSILDIMQEDLKEVRKTLGRLDEQV